MIQLVGILNITPDSFSDGGKFDSVESSLERVGQLISEGAVAIDIGAESTRPGAVLLSEEEEWSRLEKIIPAIVDKYKEKVELSLDTRHPSIAAKAINAGIGWINDVSGFSDSKMIKSCLLAKKVVLMHNLGAPADPKKTIPANLPLMETIIDWAKQKISFLERQGIERNKIIFDPGIGFGKTKEQSLEIIKSVSKLNCLKVPVMIGHSRKSFLTMFSDIKPEERDPQTSVITGYLSQKNIEYARVHNVRMNKLAVDIFATLK